MMRLCGALLSLGGCTEDPAFSQLVVVVNTDIAVPVGLDGFSVRVFNGGGRETETRSYFLGAAEGQVVLPADFGIVPKDGDPGRRVTVEVDANLGADVLFTTRAVTGFIEGKVLQLDMFLPERCIGVDCGASETCRREGCVPEGIDPDDLPEFGEDGEVPTVADWTRVFGTGMGGGDELNRNVVDVATDPDGNVSVVAQYSTTNLGEGTVSAAGAEDGFVVGLSREGETRWSATFGGDWVVVPFGAAVDGAGNTWVTGEFRGAIDLGSATFDTGAMEQTAAFVGTWDRDGTALWSGGYWDGRPTSYPTIAYGAGARGSAVVVTGKYAYDIDFGAGPLGFGEEADDPFLAAFSAPGSLAWACGIDSLTSAHGRDALPLADGGVVVTGGFTLTDFGLEQIWATQEFDGFVAAYGPDCAYRWAFTFGSASGTEDLTVDRLFDEGQRVAVDRAGNVAVAGQLIGDVDFGAGVDRAAGGSRDGFVLVLDPNGVFRWARRIGGLGNDMARGVAFGADGSVWVAGNFEAQAGVAGAELDSAGGVDAFVVGFDANGTLVHSESYGGTDDDWAYGIAWDSSSGGVVVAGLCQGQATIGGVVTDCGAGGADAVFVHRFTP